MKKDRDILLDPYTYRGLLALREIKAHECFLKAGLSITKVFNPFFPFVSFFVLFVGLVGCFVVVLLGFLVCLFCGVW